MSGHWPNPLAIELSSVELPDPKHLMASEKSCDVWLHLSGLARKPGEILAEKYHYHLPYMHGHNQMAKWHVTLKVLHIQIRSHFDNKIISRV